MTFGRDMLFPIFVKANWNKVLHNRTRKSHKTRDKENASRIPHQYKEDDKVIIQDYVGEHRRLERPTLGP